MVRDIAISVAGTSGSSLERSRRLVSWMTATFTWSATDYQRRSPEEIMARRTGNCAELAGVLEHLLLACGLPCRRVREVTIHPRSARRARAAERLVYEKGPEHSVFGLRHNDHSWLEVADENGDWFPADSATGVCGLHSFVERRLAFGDRLPPAMTAAAAAIDSMIAPFSIVALDAEPASRSEHYLVHAFDGFYGARLRSVAAWPEWTMLLREAAPLVAGAFGGRVNFHDHQPLIDRIAAAYDQLRREARRMCLVAPAATSIAPRTSPD